MGNGSGQFKITVGDTTCGVAEGDKALLHLLGEGLAPKDGLEFAIWSRDKVYSPHACACCVRGTASGRTFAGNNLIYSGSSFSQRVGNPLEILEKVVDRASQTQSVSLLFRVPESLLQGGEQAASTRQGKGHRAELAQNFMPLSGGDSLLIGSNGGEDFLESFESMSWQSNGLVDGVNQPAQYNFDSAPSGIPLFHFLD